MPTILELLYREYCRARLTEMRKQLLLRGRHTEHFRADCDPDDSDRDGRMDAQNDMESKHTTK
jgi:hypothetical protein